MSAIFQAKNQLVRCLYQLTGEYGPSSVTLGREICRWGTPVLAARFVRRTKNAALGGEATLRAAIAPSAKARKFLPSGGAAS
jgi:hypothetical protein